MGSKFSLLIGNSNYKTMNTLKSPSSDINSLNEVLTKAKYESICKTDLTLIAFNKTIEDFCTKIKLISPDNSDIVIFYFAGHGLQINGENYLCPIDMDKSNISDSTISIKDRTYTAKCGSINFYNDILQKIAETKISIKIFILDCCRSDLQFNYNRGVSPDSSFSNDLASIDAPFGSLISYSTSPGQPASDGDGDNSPFVKALIKNISIPGLSIEEVFKKTRKELYSLTKQKQVSWEHSSLIGDVCLFPVNSIEDFSIEYEKKTYADNYAEISSPIIHDYITKLKSLNWNIQEPILKDIISFLFNNKEGLNKNDLFLLGRNILQVAYGPPRGIKAFLNTGNEIILTWSKYNIFHFVNGVLYEIYFNSLGKCRKSPKYNNTIELFLTNLQGKAFSNSIIFIQNILKETNRVFYENLTTGKDWVAEVQVIKKTDELENDLYSWYVTGITLNGNNILYMEDGKILVENADYDYNSNDFATRSSFIKIIASMIVIPVSKCNLTFPDEINLKTYLSIPNGFQLRLNPVI